MYNPPFPAMAALKTDDCDYMNVPHRASLPTEASRGCRRSPLAPSNPLMATYASGGQRFTLAEYNATDRLTCDSSGARGLSQGPSILNHWNLPRYINPGLRPNYRTINWNIYAGQPSTTKRSPRPCLVSTEPTCQRYSQKYLSNISRTTLPLLGSIPGGMTNLVEGTYGGACNLSGGVPVFHPYDQTLQTAPATHVSFNMGGPLMAPETSYIRGNFHDQQEFHSPPVQVTAVLDSSKHDKGLRRAGSQYLSCQFQQPKYTRPFNFQPSGKASYNLVPMVNSGWTNRPDFISPEFIANCDLRPFSKMQAPLVFQNPGVMSQFVSPTQLQPIIHRPRILEARQTSEIVRPQNIRTEYSGLPFGTPKIVTTIVGDDLNPAVALTHFVQKGSAKDSEDVYKSVANIKPQMCPPFVRVPRLAVTSVSNSKEKAPAGSTAPAEEGLMCVPQSLEVVDWKRSTSMAVYECFPVTDGGPLLVPDEMRSQWILSQNDLEVIGPNQKIVNCPYQSMKFSIKDIFLGSEVPKPYALTLAILHGINVAKVSLPNKGQVTGPVCTLTTNLCCKSVLKLRAELRDGSAIGEIGIDIPRMIAEKTSQLTGPVVVSHGSSPPNLNILDSTEE